MKIKLSILSVGLFAALGSFSSDAQLVVNDPPLYSYLTGMTPGAPGGVRETLATINERLGRMTSFNDQLLSNQDVYERQRLYEEGLRNTMEDNFRRPSSRPVSCARVTEAMGRGGAAQGSGLAGGQAQARIVRRFTENRPSVAGLNDLVKGRADYCSSDEVARNHPNCSAEGKRPNADLVSSSLRDGGASMEGGGVKLANQSLNAEDMKAAMSYINNVIPLPLPALDEKTQETRSGQVYSANQQRFNARVGSITSAFAAQVGFNAEFGVRILDGQQVASPTTPYQQEFLSAWNSGENKEKYEKIFGSGTFPERPSEREILRLSIFKHFADVNSIVEQEAMSEDDIPKVQVEIASIQARIQWAILERLEEQNTLLSVLVAHQMDPINRDAVIRNMPGLAGQ